MARGIDTPRCRCPQGEVQETRKKKELFSVVIFWSPDPLHVDWLGFSQLATGLNQQSSDTFFVSTRDTSSTTLVGGTLVSIA
jgi:hypothetical protein